MKKKKKERQKNKTQTNRTITNLVHQNDKLQVQTNKRSH